MIGCSTYTNSLECMQYINDVNQIKILYLIILIILAVSTIYFVKSKKYKQLSKKYEMIKLMFMLPKFSSYLFIALLVFMPYFLSINTGLETYLTYINLFLWTNVTWICLFVIGMIFNYAFVKLGFKSSSHFLKSSINKR